MKKKAYGLTLVLTLLLSVLVLSFANSAAGQTGVEEEAKKILHDLVGLDISNNSIKKVLVITGCPHPDFLSNQWRKDYFQQNVDVHFVSGLRPLVLFLNNTLHGIYLADLFISPVNTTQATDGPLAFLQRLGNYTGDSMYGDLAAMLNGVDLNDNITKRTGNTELEIFNHGLRVGYYWTYVSEKGIKDQRKNVHITYDKGLFKSFYNFWKFYNPLSANYTNDESTATTQPTNLELNGNCTPTNTGLAVRINGTLTSNNIGVQNAEILLSYTNSHKDIWNNLRPVMTDRNGAFAMDLELSAGEIYLVNATWIGNESYQAAAKSLNVVMTPLDEQNVLSFISNSTVTQLSFYTDMELSFNVTGLPETVGYMSFNIKKSLLNDINSLKVYLDGNQLIYSAESQDEYWLVSFTYNHSSHTITIQLPESFSKNTSQVGYWMILAVLITIAATSAIAFIIFRPKVKNKLL